MSVFRWPFKSLKSLAWEKSKQTKRRGNRIKHFRYESHNEKNYIKVTEFDSFGLWLTSAQLSENDLSTTNQDDVSPD